MPKFPCRRPADPKSPEEREKLLRAALREALIKYESATGEKEHLLGRVLEEVINKMRS